MNSDLIGSPDDDFEMNEKELDENYNNYSDDGYQKIDYDNQYPTKDINAVKNYYLKQSQYLSGITERSIEESLFSQSHDKVSLKFDDNHIRLDSIAHELEGKELLISKYSCSDDGVYTDSIAFLYDKLQDQLNETDDKPSGNREIRRNLDQNNQSKTLSVLIN